MVPACLRNPMAGLDKRLVVELAGEIPESPLPGGEDLGEGGQDQTSIPRC